MSIIVSDVSYRYPGQELLWERLNFSVSPGRKVSVIGHNGTGKSTLLRLIAGEIQPASGSVHCSSRPWYIPQQTGTAGKSVAEALGVAEKIDALNRICRGEGDPILFDRLADDWEIESRCKAALDYWGLPELEWSVPADRLSGGEKSKLFLAALSIHRPEIILLDEPTNHLDRNGREKLYDYIATCKASVVVVSHDVALLNRVDATFELSGKGIRLYGGNYSFYRECRETEKNALAQQIASGESALRSARRKAREAQERQEKRMNRSSGSASGIPRILAGRRQENAENTNARLLGKHASLIAESRKNLSDLRQNQSADVGLKIDFDDARLHNGKMLVEAVGVNFGYTEDNMLWSNPLDVEIRSGDRVLISGDNGTGKSTLIGLLTGELAPSRGTIRKSDFSFVRIDQHYNVVCKDRTILELAREHNETRLLDHEIKTRLDRALFPQESWDRNCLTLSGGERMRLCLCCLMISNHIPDVFVLDEPTNNLDLPSLSILTDTVRQYRGTLLIVSHDSHFNESVGITKRIELFI